MRCRVNYKESASQDSESKPHKPSTIMHYMMYQLVEAGYKEVGAVHFASFVSGVLPSLVFAP